MPVAEHDPEFARKLKRETALWLKEGIITDAQKELLLGRYAVQEEAEKKAGPGRLITTISVLGSILIGVGVILFIASNWSGIPRWAKLSLIFIPMLTSYGLGYYLRCERKNFPKIGASLILLGAVIFGAGIFLIAQIYHISVHYPNGPLLWGLAVMPLAYLFRLRTILTLALIDLLIWLGMESSFHSSLYFNSPISFVTLFLITGIALWSAGLMHRGIGSFSWLSAPYVVLGILLTFTGSYVLTFDVFSVSIGDERFVWFYAGILLLFLSTIIPYAFSGEGESQRAYEIAGLALLMSIVLAAIFFLRRDPADPYINESRNGLVLFSNIVFALAVLGMIVLGYLRRNAVYINLGLLFFVLDITARYFDIFWKLLPRSIFFIAGGSMLLLGGVYLERKRRKILAAFDLEDRS